MRSIILLNPKAVVLEVKDLDPHRSGKSRSHECTVTLPDGRVVERNISCSFYRELSVGDKIRVEYSEGCLGIEYANAYPVE